MAYHSNRGGDVPRWTSSAPFAAALPMPASSILMRRSLAYGADLLILAVLFAVFWIGWAVALVASVVALLAGAAMGMMSLVTLMLPVLALAIVAHLVHGLGLWMVILVAYAVLGIASSAAATPGMRLFGLSVRDLQTGGRPTLAQALVTTVLFYVTTYPTAFLVLCVGIFTDRHRLLHDFLSGTVVVDREPDVIIYPPD